MKFMRASIAVLAICLVVVAEATSYAQRRQVNPEEGNTTSIDQGAGVTLPPKEPRPIPTDGPQDASPPQITPTRPPTSDGSSPRPGGDSASSDESDEVRVRTTRRPRPLRRRGPRPGNNATGRPLPLVRLEKRPSDSPLTLPTSITGGSVLRRQVNEEDGNVPEDEVTDVTPAEYEPSLAPSDRPQADYPVETAEATRATRPFGNGQGSGDEDRSTDGNGLLSGYIIKETAATRPPRPPWSYTGSGQENSRDGNDQNEQKGYLVYRILDKFVGVVISAYERITTNIVPDTSRRS